jgi:predicted metalloprotease with PDZ domain
MYFYSVQASSYFLKDIINGKNKKEKKRIWMELEYSKWRAWHRVLHLPESTGWERMIRNVVRVVSIVTGVKGNFVNMTFASKKKKKKNIYISNLHYSINVLHSASFKLHVLRSNLILRHLFISHHLFYAHETKKQVTSFFTFPTNN